MSEDMEIELSPVEVTAYWWVRLIRQKVREIVVTGARNIDEGKFVDIFYNYTELDWRNLYLQLIECISKDVNDYVLKGDTFGIDAFSQDTAKGGHDILNEEISKIINSCIPDIYLSSNNQKDSVIYTSRTYACVWYKSSGIRNLPKNYEPSYILTGDEEELKFYNLLVSTIITIHREDSDFNSVHILRDIFCEEYIRLNKSKENLEDVIEKFNKLFNRANDYNIVSGRDYKKTYFTVFRDIDIVGLESCMDEAQHYANVILQKTKDTEEKQFSKKLKR